MDVEVAVVGPSFGYVMGHPGVLDSPDFADQGSHLAWNERMRTVVEAREETTLAEVVNEAARRFEIRVPLGGIGPYGPQTVADVIDGIGFWSEGDDAADHFPLRYASYFVGLDADGRAIWGTARQIRISDLVRAADQRVVSFHPLRVYLHPSLPQGGEILIAFWQDFQTLWNAMWPIVEGLAAAHGAIEFFTAVQRRLSKAPILIKLRPGLEDRLAGPGQVIELLSSRPWTPTQISPVIPCSIDEAEDLLDLAGLSFVPERERWEATESKEAVFARALLEELVHHASSGLGVEYTVERISEGLEDKLRQASEAPGLVGLNLDPLGISDSGVPDESDTRDESISEEMGDELSMPEPVAFSYRLQLIEDHDLEGAAERLTDAGNEGFRINRTVEWPGSDQPRILVILERAHWPWESEDPTTDDGSPNDDG